MRDLPFETRPYGKTTAQELSEIAAKVGEATDGKYQADHIVIPKGCLPEGDFEILANQGYTVVEHPAYDESLNRKGRRDEKFGRRRRRAVRFG